MPEGIRYITDKQQRILLIELLGEVKKLENAVERFMRVHFVQVIDSKMSLLKLTHSKVDVRIKCIRHNLLYKKGHLHLAA